MKVIGKDTNGKDLILMEPGEWNMLMDITIHKARPVMEIGIPSPHDVVSIMQSEEIKNSRTDGSSSTPPNPPATGTQTAKPRKSKTMRKAAAKAKSTASQVFAKAAGVACTTKPAKPAEKPAKKPIKGQRAVLHGIVARAPGSVSVEAVLAAYARECRVETTRELRGRLGVALCDMARDGMIARPGRGLYAAKLSTGATAPVTAKAASTNQKAPADMTDAELRSRLKIAAATNAADPEARAEFLRRKIRNAAESQTAGTAKEG
jgi:hypothetical protein